jgi:hypothetical protein
MDQAFAQVVRAAGMYVPSDTVVVAVIYAIAQLWISRINGKKTDAVHEIVNSQRTAMQQMIETLQGRVGELEGDKKAQQAHDSQADARQQQKEGIKP